MIQRVFEVGRINREREWHDGGTRSSDGTVSFFLLLEIVWPVSFLYRKTVCVTVQSQPHSRLPFSTHDLYIFEGVLIYQFSLILWRTSSSSSSSSTTTTSFAAKYLIPFATIQTTPPYVPTYPPGSTPARYYSNASHSRSAPSKSIQMAPQPTSKRESYAGSSAIILCITLPTDTIAWAVRRCGQGIVWSCIVWTKESICTIGRSWRGERVMMICGMRRSFSLYGRVGCMDL